MRQTDYLYIYICRSHYALRRFDDSTIRYHGCEGAGNEWEEVSDFRFARARAREVPRGQRFKGEPVRKRTDGRANETRTTKLHLRQTGTASNGTRRKEKGWFRAPFCSAKLISRPVRRREQSSRKTARRFIDCHALRSSTDANTAALRCLMATLRCDANID